MNYFTWTSYTLIIEEIKLFFAITNFFLDSYKEVKEIHGYLLNSFETNSVWYKVIF